jgi:hypothetical protein
MMKMCEESKLILDDHKSIFSATQERWIFKSLNPSKGPFKQERILAISY